MDVNRIIDSLYDKIDPIEDSKLMCNRYYVSKAKRLIKKLQNHKAINKQVNK
jgi:hypothetical protein